MCPNQQETTNLVTFTEEFLYGKLHFLHSEKGTLQYYTAFTAE